MNLKHAVQTIAKRGLTERQARFLVLVARHSGVCVMRQYSTFAGIVFGQKTRKFFNKLVHLGLVSTYDCAHNRGRVYHLRHRAIYEATVRGERASPIREAILTELRWYFERVAALQQRRVRLPIGLASSGAARRSTLTVTRCCTGAGNTTASGCWRPLRRRSWPKRSSRVLGRSNLSCCHMPIAIWRCWWESRNCPSLTSRAARWRRGASAVSILIKGDKQAARWTRLPCRRQPRQQASVMVPAGAWGAC